MISRPKKISRLTVMAFLYRSFFIFFIFSFLSVSTSIYASCIRIEIGPENPLIGEEQIKDSNAKILLNDTEKILEGYIEWKQVQKFILSEQKKEIINLGTCNPVLTPILLNNNLQFIYLDFIDGTLGALSECFNLDLYYPLMTGALAPRIIILDDLYDPEKSFQGRPPFNINYSIYDQSTVQNHAKRCKVTLKGVFKNEVPFIFEVNEIKEIEHRVSRIEFQAEIENVRRSEANKLRKKSRMICEEAVHDYGFWNILKNQDAVEKAAKKGLSCGLTLESSEEKLSQYNSCGKTLKETGFFPAGLDFDIAEQASNIGLFCIDGKVTKDFLENLQDTCDCARQLEKGTSNSFKTYKKRFVKTCQNQVSKMGIICKDYSDVD